MLKMGGMSSLLNLLPGMGQLKEKIAGAGLDDKVICRQIALINSMTPKERRNFKLLNGSRKKRIAIGSGQTPADVNKLLKQFDQMQTVMKKMGKMDKKSFLRQGIKGLFKS